MENNSFKPIIWKNWPVLGPTSLLIFLFFYLLMPSTILKHSSLHEESGYLEKKANLEADVRALKEIKENAVCSGDQLVIPKDNKDALLPPINLDTLVNKLEKSVVLILVDFDNTGMFAWGTGFFVSPSLILTNGHVVSGEGENPSAVYIVNKFLGIKQVEVQNVKFDDDFSEDFAVLSLGENLGTPLPLKKIRNPDSLKLVQVYSAGFPGSVVESDENFLNLINTDKVSVPDLVVTDGTISSYQKFFGAVSAFVHTAQISQGNSGGPLVNRCGQVLGVNTFLISEDDGIRNFSLTSTEVLNYLNRLGISPNIAATECD
jgi:S1-C subfamily serine protease